jgi:hypothetical protein
MHASLQTNCYDSDDFSIDNQRICVTQDPGDASEYVIYYFHGLNGNADDMGKDKMLAYLDAYWEQRLPGKKPVLIGYSLGQRTNLALPGRLKKLMDDVFPSIESTNLQFKPKFRTAIGVSMGGWNLFQLQMEDTSYFKKSAILCPAIPIIHPWSTGDEIAAYRKRTGANWFYVNLMLRGVSDSYGGDQAAFMPFNPYSRLTVHRGPIGNLYIAAETQDEFGFQEGAAHLMEVATQAGSPVEWHLRPGGHCKSQRMDEVAAFLTLK